MFGARGTWHEYTVVGVDTWTGGGLVPTCPDPFSHSLSMVHMQHSLTGA